MSFRIRGNTFIDFPIVTNPETDTFSSPANNVVPQKSIYEKPIPVYITKRTIKYNYHEDEELKLPILWPKLRHSSIRYDSHTTDVRTKINRILSAKAFELDGAKDENIFQILKDMAISPYNYPKCIERASIPPKSQCNICEFANSTECQILHNPSILDDISPWFAQSKRYRQENLERRDAVLDAIYSELKDHGRPLHYEVLAQIMQDRYPHLHLNAKKIVHFLGWHPDKFEWVDKGVYRAK
jgi:hypothetical protein